MSMTKVTSGIIDTLDASKLTGTLPAMDGSNLTGIDALPAAGTSGNVLTSDGTNWASGAAPAGGTPVWTHIATVNAYQAGFNEITGLDGSVYKQHKIIYSGIHSNQAAADFQMSVAFSGAWRTSTYYSSTDFRPTNNSSQHYSQSNAGHWVLQRFAYNGPGMGMCGEINIWNDSTDYMGYSATGASNNYNFNGMGGWTISGGQVQGNGHTLSAIRFGMSGHTFYSSTGYFAVYGRTEQ